MIGGAGAAGAAGATGAATTGAGLAMGPAGWAMLGVSALGTVMGSNSSKKAAKTAEEAQQQQMKSAQQDLEFRQKMYTDAQGKYAPLEQQLLGQATSNQPLGYDMLSGQMQQQYADALRRIGEQGNIGMGGLAGGAARQSQFGLATGLGGAYAQGQMNRLNLGQSLLGRDPSTQLGMNVSGGIQNMSNLYGQQANMYGQLAGAGAGAMSKGIQGLGYGLGQYFTLDALKKMQDERRMDPSSQQ
jgi:hypothetical protein